MPAPVRFRTMLAITAALVAALMLSVSVQEADAAKICNISGKERKLGATYVTALKVRTVTCGKAEKVVKAYHRCRFDAGRQGRQVQPSRAERLELQRPAVQQDPHAVRRPRDVQEGRRSNLAHLYAVHLGRSCGFRRAGRGWQAT